ncbi:transcription elongation factor GreA [Patescibacteria group bacterium]|nr:transcription elongation factor GreA [Patescibacteria group bacterium]
MIKKNYLTEEGLSELKKELEHLQKVERKEVSDRIRKALEEGDISESGEYSEAKEQQAFVEGRIIELASKIKNAVIIKKSGQGKSIRVGSTIVVKSNGKEIEYKIVGSDEADPVAGKISNESPIGQAFLDREVGEIVKVETPVGQKSYRVMTIG